MAEHVTFYPLQKLREHLRRDSTAEFRILTEHHVIKSDENESSRPIFDGKQPY